MPTMRWRTPRPLRQRNMQVRGRKPKCPVPGIHYIVFHGALAHPDGALAHPTAAPTALAQLVLRWRVG